MGMPTVKSACENCGASKWSLATQRDERKAALIRAHITDGRLGFNPTAGTPVDIVVCVECGMIRLFAVEAR